MFAQHSFLGLGFCNPRLVLGFRFLQRNTPFQDSIQLRIVREKPQKLQVSRNKLLSKNKLQPTLLPLNRASGCPLRPGTMWTSRGSFTTPFAPGTAARWQRFRAMNLHSLSLIWTRQIFLPWAARPSIASGTLAPVWWEAAWCRHTLPL